VITMDEVITPQTVKQVAGEGMPAHKEVADDMLHHLKPHKEIPRGDLYIVFDIAFPKHIPNQYKQVIVEALRQNHTLNEEEQ
jgi:DnaJ-class molecular chaperone